MGLLERVSYSALPTIKEEEVREEMKKDGRYPIKGQAIQMTQEEIEEQEADLQVFEDLKKKEQIMKNKS